MRVTGVSRLCFFGNVVDMSSVHMAECVCVCSFAAVNMQHTNRKDEIGEAPKLLIIYCLIRHMAVKRIIIIR